MTDDRREPHAVRRHMFIPTSQFSLYGHVTSRGRHGNGSERREDDSADDGDNDDDDDADDDDDDDEVDTAQLTVICRVARAVSFYLVNVFLILVFVTHAAATSVADCFLVGLPHLGRIRLRLILICVDCLRLSDGNDLSIY